LRNIVAPGSCSHPDARPGVRATHHAIIAWCAQVSHAWRFRRVSQRAFDAAGPTAFAQLAGTAAQ
jgi:hypothetical protein